MLHFCLERPFGHGALPVPFAALKIVLADIGQHLLQRADKSTPLFLPDADKHAFVIL